MSHPFRFRPGTNDEAMFNHLTTHNEYRLPDQIGPGEIIVDVGAHIGSFCYSALTRGARHVFGFEAEPSNFECASRNLQSFGDRVRLTNKAVWRSDRPAGTLSFSYSEEQANTGGGSVVWESDGPGIPSVPFDDVIDQITAYGRRRINLLKIDCEGSEFPILLTATKLDRIDRIAGEFHEIGCTRNPQPIPDQARVPGIEAFTLEVMLDHLRRAGFHVESERAGDSSLGLFFAARPAATATSSGRLKTFWHHLSRNMTSRPGRRTVGAALGTER